MEDDRWQEDIEEHFWVEGHLNHTHTHTQKQYHMKFSNIAGNNRTFKLERSD